MNALDLLADSLNDMDQLVLNEKTALDKQVPILRSDTSKSSVAAVLNSMSGLSTEITKQAQNVSNSIQIDCNPLLNNTVNDITVELDDTDGIAELSRAMVPHFREAIAGPVWGNVFYNVRAMLIFLGIFLLLAILKKLFIDLTSRWNANIKKHRSKSSSQSRALNFGINRDSKLFFEIVQKALNDGAILSNPQYVEKSVMIRILNTVYEPLWDKGGNGHGS